MQTSNKATRKYICAANWGTLSHRCLSMLAVSFKTVRHRFSWFQVCLCMSSESILSVMQLTCKYVFVSLRIFTQLLGGVTPQFSYPAVSLWIFHS